MFNVIIGEYSIFVLQVKSYMEVWRKLITVGLDILKYLLRVAFQVLRSRGLSNSSGEVSC